MTDDIKKLYTFLNSVGNYSQLREKPDYITLFNALSDEDKQELFLLVLSSRGEKNINVKWGFFLQPDVIFEVEKSEELTLRLEKLLSLSPEHAKVIVNDLLPGLSYALSADEVISFTGALISHKVNKKTNQYLESFYNWIRKDYTFEEYALLLPKMPKRAKINFFKEITEDKEKRQKAFSYFKSLNLSNKVINTVGLSIEITEDILKEYLNNFPLKNNIEIFSVFSEILFTQPNNFHILNKYISYQKIFDEVLSTEVITSKKDFTKMACVRIINYYNQTGFDLIFNLNLSERVQNELALGALRKDKSGNFLPILLKKDLNPILHLYLIERFNKTNSSKYIEQSLCDLTSEKLMLMKQTIEKMLINENKITLPLVSENHHFAFHEKEIVYYHLLNRVLPTLPAKKAKKI